MTERMEYLLRQSRENTADLRAQAEGLLRGEYHPRVEEFGRTALLFVEAQEQLEKLHAERIQNPTLEPVANAHPEFMERHERLRQLRDESLETLIADGYAGADGDD